MVVAQWRSRLSACSRHLWPGLYPLWVEGTWGGLLVAACYAAALNLMLLLTFIIPSPLGGWWLWGSWLALGTGWTIGIWRSSRAIRSASEQGPVLEDLFLQAQAEYLRGHWFEAESLLERLLDADPRDADAHLMLATLLRHTKRLRDARRQLRVLQQIEGAAKWQLEIERELQHLQKAQCPTSEITAAPPGEDAGLGWSKAA